MATTSTEGLTFLAKPFAELTTTELYEILKARFAVFYMEQHIYYQDFDDVDYNAVHLALFREGKVIAYARLFEDKEPGQWLVGRLLTIERGQGFGRYVMEQAALEAQRRGAASVSLHAQMQAAPFYDKLGFKPVGDVFMEADIPHVQMTKELI